MTRTSIEEYVEAIGERYRHGRKREKGQILDEAVRVTGYHRKALIRTLRKRSGRRSQGQRGRRRQYQGPVIKALNEVWEATDRICTKRLHPFIPELIPVLRRHGNRTITAEVEVQLTQMSPATMDRLLRPFRRSGGRRPLSTTKPGSLLKSMIPIRTFGDWEESLPGFLEVDLVAHCGESTEGFYLTTLNTVDIATGWVECQTVWGKDRNGLAPAFTAWRNGSPSPSWAWTATMGESSSISISTDTASATRSLSLAPGPTRRMPAPTSSRRTGVWSAGWWGMIASLPRLPSAL